MTAEGAGSAVATLRGSGRRLQGSPAGPARCRRKFLRYFPQGFSDPKYLQWERDYKWTAHDRWNAVLGREAFRALLAAERYTEIARHAVVIESRTNLLFSFEKMALRDAVRSIAGAAAFSDGLYDLLHGSGTLQKRFDRWCETVAALPRRQTRVLTWPVVTIFGFIAQPKMHFYLKPTVTKLAAEEYGYDLAYRSRPSWETYADLLDFAGRVSADVADLKPRDMIDIQSFLWVLGSSEYP